jgi:hypothetical protein
MAGQPFLALITPLGGSPGEPTHPWVPPSGEVPPGYWGGVAPPLPTHPIAPGGPPPSIWPSPGHPAHPIAPGGRPPGIWGGPPLYPDQGLPGPQPIPTPPIYLPPGTIPGAKPEHPIYIPPTIWPSPGVPTHPIVIPPPGSGEKPEVLENWEVKTAWSPQTGWVVAIVPTENATVPTPSS